VQGRLQEPPPAFRPIRREVEFVNKRLLIQHHRAAHRLHGLRNLNCKSHIPHRIARRFRRWLTLARDLHKTKLRVRHN
jgi:hypothetical protein